MKKFCDIIWTLQELSTFETQYGQQMTIDYLRYRVKSVYLGGRPTNFGSLVTLLEGLCLVRKDEWQKFFITRRGKLMLKLSRNNAYELNEEQKKWLAQWYILANYALLRPWFQLIALSPEYDCLYHAFPKELRQLTEEMLYLGVAGREGELVKLEPPFWWALSDSQPKMTETELMEELENQRMMGEKAEEAAHNFERKRLQSLGWHEYAKKVKLISKEYVNAGYDLISFSTKSRIPDRFIEVKIFGHKEAFYWSYNEMVVASFLQNKYYLYLVQFVNEEPVIWLLRNPAKQLDAFGFNLEPIQYRVQVDMSELNKHAQEDLIQGMECREVKLPRMGQGDERY